MIDKSLALFNFWSGFGLTAYPEYSVPEKAEPPYITYEVATDSLDNILNLSASLWYRSSSWKEIQAKAEEIGEFIVRMYPPTIEFDTGRLYIAKGTPFAQRMGDPDDSSIRRIVLNIRAEFLTSY